MPENSVAIIRKWVAPIIKYYIKNNIIFNPSISGSFLRRYISYKVAKTPLSILIEPICGCNLKCPLCTTPHKYMTRKQGMMNYETYQKLLDDVHKFALVFNFNFAGEPFLNPNLFKMVRDAAEYNIFTVVDTNSTLINKQKIGEILDSQLNLLIVSIDSANPTIFEQFRAGANFHKTIEQIRKLCEVKKEQKKTFPLIMAEVIVSRENENRLQAMYEWLMNKIGVDGVWFKTICFPLHSQGFSEDHPISDLVEKYLPKNGRKRYNFVNGKLELINPTILCSWEHKCVILWDGRVGACCYDYDGTYTFGNLNEQHFLDIWNSKKYRYYREKLIRHKKLKLCKKCAYSIDFGN